MSIELETSQNPLVSFLYDLLRDKLVASRDVEALVRKAEQNRLCEYSNEHLARYAKEIAERLQPKAFGSGIRPTVYTRPDKVCVLEWREGQWLVRDVRGPAWFWDKRGQGAWTISTSLSLDEIQKLSMPFEEAVDLLRVVPKLREWEGSKHLKSPTVYPTCKVTGEPHRPVSDDSSHTYECMDCGEIRFRK